MSDSGRSAAAEATRVADGASTPAVCAHCGASIDTTEWHPVRSRNDDDEFHVYAFCDEECRRAWDDGFE